MHHILKGLNISCFQGFMDNSFIVNVFLDIMFGIQYVFFWYLVVLNIHYNCQFLNVQILIVRSADALTKSQLGSTPSELIESPWPCRVLTKVPSSTSHILMVISSEPLAKYPFGKTSSTYIGAIWSSNTSFTVIIS